MRTEPSLSAANGTDYYSFYRDATFDAFNSMTLDSVSIHVIGIYNNSEISGTAGMAGWVRWNSSAPTDSLVALNAEL